MNPSNTGLVSDTFLVIAVVIALVLVAVLAYIYSEKNLKTTMGLTLGVAAFIGLSQLFISWQNYLANVFLSSADSSGAVVPISRTGFLIFVDGWLLWLFPSIILIVVVAYLTLKLSQIKKIKEEITPKPSEEKQVGGTSEIITLELEIETTKRDLANARSQIDKVTREKNKETERNMELQIRIKQLLNEINELKR